jgi:hypothetical protein
MSAVDKTLVYGSHTINSALQNASVSKTWEHQISPIRSPICLFYAISVNFHFFCLFRWHHEFAKTIAHVVFGHRCIGVP